MSWTDREPHIRIAVQRFVQMRSRPVHRNAIIKHFFAGHRYYGFWQDIHPQRELDTRDILANTVRRDILRALESPNIIVWGQNLVCYKSEEAEHCDHSECLIQRTHEL